MWYAINYTDAGQTVGDFLDQHQHIASVKRSRYPTQDPQESPAQESIKILQDVIHTLDTVDPGVYTEIIKQVETAIKFIDPTS